MATKQKHAPAPAAESVPEMPQALKDAFALDNPMPVPSGFEAVAALSAIEYEDIADGKVATYLGARTVKSKVPKYGRDTFTIYDFEENESMGWGLWGCAGLDLLMKNVPVGSVVWIRYAGKGPHPTDASQTLHRFQVALKGGKRAKPADATPAPTPPKGFATAGDEPDLPF